MALRAVIEHPKTADLMRILGLPRYAALGCLEALWHFTGRFTPRGDIGKYSAQQIEAWIGWDREPGLLISAFIQSGWIDKHPTYRLMAHDWPHHADKATKNALKRAGLDFCTYTVPTPSVHDEHMSPNLGNISRLPEPVPVPESVFSEKPVRLLPPLAGPASEPELPPALFAAFERCRDLHPNCTDPDAALRAFLALFWKGEITEADADAIHGGMRKWLDSEVWAAGQERFSPEWRKFSAWISGRAWRANPKPSAAAKQANQSSDGDRAEFVPPWRKTAGGAA